ncbi:hypothetical protein [Roseovarius indicus]|uniref:Uncharacterized protein n=1 Tax=Roseovarius indicus TaxID=540747 RepID=A0A5P3AM78_9RHOB|nr:hypothetical protein [Roseovarius indicus]QEW29558.1 hypothetical protein RIdsm_05403 [Roseovarius indicus]SFE47656.1 hypothetical protein SAMN04488031_110179 [Roseovarius indicus]
MKLKKTTHHSDPKDQGDPIWFVNEGRFLRSTNYWNSSFARSGMCYLSGSRGHWRLLVPSGAEEVLKEFRAVKRATIEPSIIATGHFDIVAQDGTRRPFCVSINKQMIDRRIARKHCRLLVYSERGLVTNLPVQVFPSFPAS